MAEIPTLDALLSGEISEGYSDDPIALGWHNFVITGCEVRKGNKSGIPYLNLTLTVFDGDDARRKCWGMSSFSEKALYMPGGVAQLLQATGIGDSLPDDVAPNELPAAISKVITGTPVRALIGHEHAGAPGAKKFNSDGTPKMKETVEAYEAPTEEFLAAFEAEASGVDEDLPF